LKKRSKSIRKFLTKTTSKGLTKKIGEWKSGKFDGHGVLWDKKDGKYEGDFKGGKKHGKGKQLYHNKEIYEGLRIQEEEISILNIVRRMGG